MSSESSEENNVSSFSESDETHSTNDYQDETKKPHVGPTDITKQIEGNKKPEVSPRKKSGRKGKGFSPAELIILAVSQMHMAMVTGVRKLDGMWGFLQRYLYYKGAQRQLKLSGERTAEALKQKVSRIRVDAEKASLGMKFLNPEFTDDEKLHAAEKIKNPSELVFLVDQALNVQSLPLQTLKQLVEIALANLIVKQNKENVIPTYEDNILPNHVVSEITGVDASQSSRNQKYNAKRQASRIHHVKKESHISEVKALKKKQIEDANTRHREVLDFNNRKLAADREFDREYIQVQRESQQQSLRRGLITSLAMAKTDVAAKYIQEQLERLDKE